jgi:hypothetical protein
MAFDIIGAIKTVGGIITEPIKGWQERKTLKAQTKSAVEKLNAEAQVEGAKAKLELIKQGKQIEADWDSRAQEQMKFSKKDEVLMTILFFPVILLFLSALCPDDWRLQDRVINSVNALEEFPLWYVVLLCGIVAAVFGLRWLIAPLVTKMMSKKIGNGT